MAPDKQLYIGIGAIFLASWLYGFGYLFVQALGDSIPDIELNALRLMGELCTLITLGVLFDCP